MNILTIEPNLVKKTARITGKVAVGELVDVVIDDVSEINSESLRLRVFCAGRVIAQYPAPGKAESFGEAGDDLTCRMRFDSVEARRMCIGRETPVLLVLEDIGDNAQLYFTQEWSLKGWPGIDTDEKPSDFSVYAFPTLVTKWTKELEDAKSAYDSHAGSKANPHEVTKYQVGLGRVDNTSDSEKPVSVATASAIDAEKRRAELMESNLLETVKSETAARISGDDGLKRLVEAEKTRAMNAEAAVSAEAAGALSAESERAFAEESRIANLVGAETERAMSAEKGNDDAIEAEAARAKEKESQIEGMVDAERERATAREDELRYALTHESAYLKSLIDAINGVKIKVVDSLPAVGEANVIYLVPSEKSETQNVKDEYLWVDGEWEKIGTTDVDLSQYAKKDDVEYVGDRVNEAFGELGVVEDDIEELQATVGGMAQDIDGANMRSINAFNLAQAVDEKAIKPWDSEREYAVGDMVTREGRIWMCKTEGQFDSWNARRWRMFVADTDVDTALEGKLGVGDRAADSAKLGGVDAGEYALKTDVPKRVSNDADTSRIDGEGNVYEAQFVAGGYYTATLADGSTVTIPYLRKDMDYERYVYRTSDSRYEVMFYYASASVYIKGSRISGDFSSFVGADPTANDALPSGINKDGVVYTFYKQSGGPNVITDRLARESQLTGKLDKTGDTMTGPLIAEAGVKTKVPVGFHRRFKLSTGSNDYIEISEEAYQAVMDGVTDIPSTVTDGLITDLVVTDSETGTVYTKADIGDYCSFQLYYEGDGRYGMYFLILTDNYDSIVTNQGPNYGYCIWKENKSDGSFGIGTDVTFNVGRSTTLHSFTAFDNIPASLVLKEYITEDDLPKKKDVRKYSRYSIETPDPRLEYYNGQVCDAYYVSDYATSTIVATTNKPIRVHFPEPTVGDDDEPMCRDFIVKVKVMTDTPPTISFVKHPSDTDIGFDAVDESWATLEPGTNYFSFTESER